MEIHVTPGLTDLVARYLRYRSDSASDKLVLDAAIAYALETGEGWIDSHRLGDALFERRLLVTGSHGDPVQTRQYVQHLLREAKHVCRYADGGEYRIHRAEQCSPSCAEHGTHRKPLENPLCPNCFIRTNAEGVCGYCQ